LLPESKVLLHYRYFNHKPFARRYQERYGKSERVFFVTFSGKISLMALVRLYLLGEVRLEREGVPVEPDTRKALALAAFLAISKRAYRRDTLAAFFWSDSDQSASRAALRRTLSALRKVLPADCLITARDQVSLCTGSTLWVDLLEFRTLLAKATQHHPVLDVYCPECSTDLQAAISLVRGSFMDGFSLRDSLSFDDWQFQESEQVRREVAGVLIRLVDSYQAAGEFETSLDYARRWLALDSLNESAHRRLMLLYSASGQRSAALRQYRECVRILDQELGVPPLEETTHLNEAIRKNQVFEGSSSIARPFSLTDQTRLGTTGSLHKVVEPISLGAQIPMVGRESELETLCHLYTKAQPRGSFVVIQGEPGIGKTRLAQEFLSWVKENAGQILQARCYEGENNLAYGAIIEAMLSNLETSGSSDWLNDIAPFELAEVVRLLPHLGEKFPGVIALPQGDSPGAQTRFYSAICRVMFAMVTKPFFFRPGVLFLDDLQWADEASLELLAYLLRRLSDWPLFVLVTWQSINPRVDSRLARLAHAVSKQDQATFLTLTRLDDRQVIKLVDIVQRQHNLALNPSDSALLAKGAEGLPLFLLAYLESWLKTSLKKLPPGEFDMSRAPESIQVLFQARLSGLSETAHQLIQTAAVIGRSFDFDILLDVSGRTEEEIVAALDELAAFGLVREISPPGEIQEGQSIIYDFSHEQLRLFVYQGLSMARKRLLHHRAADSLVKRQAGSHRLAYAGQVAFHYRQAGETVLAAQAHRRAGEYARSLYANADALFHFESALALGEPDRSGLHAEIGRLQTLQGNYAAALRSFEAAAALCTPENLPGVELSLAHVLDRLGDWAQAEDHYQAALAALQIFPDDNLRAQVLADWSLTCFHKGDDEAAQALVQQAAKLAENLPASPALGQVLNLHGVLARSMGQPDRASVFLERCLEVTNSLGLPAIRTAALNNLALALGDLGLYERAIKLAYEALTLSIELGDRHREAAVRSNLSDLLRASGDQNGAMNQLKQAVSIFAEVGLDTGTWQPEIWKLVEW
jgi:DNA-binding SARP family transcriptional activator/Flp pilus assembly protein TadD